VKVDWGIGSGLRVRTGLRFGISVWIVVGSVIKAWISWSWVGIRISYFLGLGLDLGSGLGLGLGLGGL